jgi:hypothetical protein
VNVVQGYARHRGDPAVSRSNLPSIRAGLGDKGELSLTTTKPETPDEITLEHIWSVADELTRTCPFANPDERFVHAVQESFSACSDTTTEILGLMNMIVGTASPLEREEARRLVNSLETAFEQVQVSMLNVCLRVADERGFRRGVQAHAMAMLQRTGT